MKKIFALLMAAVMALCLLSACSSKDGGSDASDTPETSGTTAPDTENNDKETPDETDGEDASGTYGDFTTVEEGKLHMSTNAAFPPYEMTTDDNDFEGIDVEIAQAIAEKLGLELVVDNMGFDAALTAAQTGQSDMVMAGVTVNKERLEVMDFTDSYATGVQVIIVPVDSDITTVDDLANAQMIGTQKATTGYLYCSAPVDDPDAPGYGEDHVTAYETGALAVMALINGQVDAVVIDNEPAKSYVAANLDDNGEPLLKILDTEFAVEDYAIGVKKDNDALLNAINTAMNELKTNGTIQEIVDRYISAE